MTKRSLLCYNFAGLAVVTVCLLVVSPAPRAVIATTADQKVLQTAAKVSPPPRSVIQKLRVFLGLNPPVAVGGTRSGQQLKVCLISPWPNQPVGVTTPVLAAVGPLNELRIEQNGQLLWDKRASTTEAIEGPINWPIRPLTSGEVITLKLRPRGASGGDFVSYTFRVDDKKALEANRIKLAQLGRESSSWYRYIESIGTRQHTSVAPLIASPTMPDDLRQQLNCTEALK